jgi:SAM-dependent methyltransferase
MGDKGYKLNKILNENAEVSYKILVSSSLSIEGRKDVEAFKKFIESNYTNGAVLDLGCGPLEWPAYLPKDIEKAYGIDPLDSKFKGMFYTGVAEYMPFANKTFDSIICGTSLDHVFDLDKTVSEVARTLKTDGKFLVWTNCELKFKTKMIVRWMWCMNYITPRYETTECGHIFKVPKGAVDPFHKEYLSPKKIKKVAQKYGLVLTKEDVDKQNNMRNLFLCFEKR